MIDQEIRNQILSNNFVVHQSRLKTLLGPYPFKFLEEKTEELHEKQHFTLGKLAETLFLEPEKVDRMFEKISSMPPEGMVADIIRETFQTDTENTFHIEMEENEDAWVLMGIGANLGKGRWSDEVMFKKFKALQDYWSYLKTKEPGREPVSLELYQQGEALAAGFAASDQTAPLFARTPNHDILVQYYFEFTYMDTPCGGTIDVIEIDKTKKTLRVIDIKTTSRGWRSAAKANRWDIQGAFYTHALHECTPMVYSDYELLNPIYVVSHVNHPNNPRVIHFGERDILTGTLGANVYRTTAYGSNMPVNLPYTIEGFHDLLERYRFHQTVDNWDKKRELFEDDYKEHLDLY